VDKIRADIIVIGAGAAGLRAAIEAASIDSKLRIALISKVYPMRSHTVSAEGGAAAVIKEYDNFDSHAYDTIKGSDFLADQDAVELFVRLAPQELLNLEKWGLPWARDENGRMAARAFGGMSVKRTFFAADKTGFYILHTLFQRSLMYDNIERYDEWFVTSLIVEKGRFKGLTAIDIKDGTLHYFEGKAAIICTGGIGQLYKTTSNGAINTGDGMALAYRVGAPLKDMEFVQFHPTGLPGKGFLITEAARGEGGYLLNNKYERFMKKYAPEKLELAARDVVSRAIYYEIKEGRGFEGKYGAYVGLDIRHLGKEVIEKKLPTVKEMAEKYAGVDPYNELIPVRPTMHYMMGGVHTNKNAETPIAGLYAAGEAACVSINGANRLGSNSLTECLVFGAIAGRNAANFALRHDYVEVNKEEVLNEEKRIFEGLLKKENGIPASEIIFELKDTMEEKVGIIRNGKELEEAFANIMKLKEKFKQVSVLDKSKIYNTDFIQVLELDFMLDVAEAITYSALKRKESRGAHYRIDYPKRDDEHFLAHQLIYKTEYEPRIELLPVVITRWQPIERKY
jgi:succinate dehydrogenase / fumarate reductase flavoprotein subunit